MICGWGRYERVGEGRERGEGDVLSPLGWQRMVSLRKLSSFFIFCRAAEVNWLSCSARTDWISSRSSGMRSWFAARLYKLFGRERKTHLGDTSMRYISGKGTHAFVAVVLVVCIAAKLINNCS